MIVKLNHLLIIALGFLGPITVAGGNLIAGLIILLWFLSGNYKQKIQKILSNKIAISSLLFFLAYIFGLLWAFDLEDGLKRVAKMIEFGLLIPILISIVDKKNFETYLLSFFLAIALTVILSFLIFLEIISPFYGSDVANPVVFSSHISHGPIVAIGFYFATLKLFSQKWEAMKARKIYNTFLLLLSFFSMVGVLITLGRAGHIVFFILLMLLFIQILGFSLKSILLGALAGILIFSFAFSSLSGFKAKAEKTNFNLSNISENQLSSIGRRFVMFENSLEIFKQYPFFGSGTGSLIHEYEKVMNERKKSDPDLLLMKSTTNNPHNMYILVAAELGIIGLILLFNLYYQQFKLAIAHKNKLKKNLLIGVLISFFALNFSDSYFLGHFSTFLYAYLVSILSID